MEIGNLGDQEWIDWFNQDLPDWFQLKETDEILIHNFKKFKNRVLTYNNLDKRKETFQKILQLLSF